MDRLGPPLSGPSSALEPQGIASTVDRILNSINSGPRSSNMRATHDLYQCVYMPLLFEERTKDENEFSTRSTPFMKPCGSKREGWTTKMVQKWSKVVHFGLTPRVCEKWYLKAEF